MGKNTLPIHPTTGLRALGLFRGEPIWPVIGGDGSDDGDTTDQPTLTHSQSVRRQEEIHARMEELGKLDELNEDDESEFADLRSEFDMIDKHRKRLERAAELTQVRSAAAQIPSTRFRTERGAPSGSQRTGGDYDRDAILEPDSIEDCRFRNPWDLSEVRTFGRETGEVTSELRARALSAIEKMQAANDKVRSAATAILEGNDDKNGSLARQVLLTSSPAYMRAWSKLARNQGHSLSPEESRAMAESRAMNLTDANGGYLVPFQLDPTVIITANGSLNEIRKVARQVVATGDVWNGVSAGSVSWSWDAEATEVSDDSPTFAQPSIPISTARGFVPISIEALEDEANVTAEVAKLLAFGKDELESVAFVTGTGSGQPKGIVTALAAQAGSIVGPLTAETFALADIYALQAALPARYRAQASWLANNLIYNRVRQFDTNGGAGLWERVGNDRPAQLLGRPVIEAEAMDGTWNPAITEAHNYVAVHGDFSNYVIADRIGMAVEFIPHLFGTNGRPKGQRGWFAYYRTGADVVNPAAFRMLDIPTTV